MNVLSQPSAVYSEQENTVTYATKEAPYYVKPISIYITTLRDLNTNQVVGIRFTEFHMIAENLTLRGRFPQDKPLPLRTILAYALRMSNLTLMREIKTAFILRRFIRKAVLPVDQQELITPLTPI